MSNYQSGVWTWLTDQWLINCISITVVVNTRLTAAVGENNRTRQYAYFQHPQTEANKHGVYFKLYIWTNLILNKIIQQDYNHQIPSEFKKMIWNMSSPVERKLRNWWILTYFDYSPVYNMIIADIVTIKPNRLDKIFPIVPLGYGWIIH